MVSQLVPDKKPRIYQSLMYYIYSRELHVFHSGEKNNVLSVPVQQKTLHYKKDYRPLVFIMECYLVLAAYRPLLCSTLWETNSPLPLSLFSIMAAHTHTHIHTHSHTHTHRRAHIQWHIDAKAHSSAFTRQNAWLKKIKNYLSHKEN